jgi:hypothetical protein
MRNLKTPMLLIALILILSACAANHSAQSQGTENGAPANESVAETPAAQEAKSTDSVTPENWPDNEFTRHIPQPDFPISVTGSGGDMNDFVVIFKGADVEQIKSYVEKVKESGFNLRQDVEEYRAGRVTFYSFEAENEEGYEIEVFSVKSRAGLTLEKP